MFDADILVPGVICTVIPHEDQRFWNFTEDEYIVVQSHVYWSDRFDEWVVKCHFVLETGRNGGGPLPVSLLRIKVPVRELVRDSEQGRAHDLSTEACISGV